MCKIVIKTKFLINDVDRYVISGDPGVGLCAMTRDGVAIGMCRKRYFEIASSNTQVRICPDCTIEKLRTHVLKSLAIDIAHSVPSVTEHLYIGGENELARCDEGKMLVKDCLDAFENGAETFAFVMLNKLAGEILRGEGKGLSFYFHSNESSHNNPHVHVDYKHKYQASINILTGEIEAGCLPGKAKREAAEIILQNRDKLIKHWNSHTNGIFFDANVDLGQKQINTNPYEK